MDSQAQGPHSGPICADLGPRFDSFAATLRRPVVFFDIEATGTDPSSDRIVELSALKVYPPPKGVQPPQTWRINPRVRIPSEAQEVHGISNRDLEQAPTFADLADTLAEVFSNADLAGFSITRFDIRILHAEFARVGRSLDLSNARIIDSQVIFHQREPRHLGAALQFYRGKELLNAHGAEADTIAALEVFAGQLAHYEDLVLDLDGLHSLSNAHNDGYCDLARRFTWRDREPVFNFGRLRGRSLRWAASDPNERRYLRWFVESGFEDDAKEIVRQALRGRIRRRSATADGSA